MDVHHIFDVFHVPEGEFDRLISKFDHCYTNYIRPTRLLYCVIRLSEVVLLYYMVVCRLTCLKLTTKSAMF